MNAPRVVRLTAGLLTGGILLAATPRASRAADGAEGVTAVSSRVSKDYVRQKLPDGSFEPEYYSFGKGGNWEGSISDSTIDNLGFTDIARVIASPLADKNYLPARDPNKTRLLIMVYWGTTTAPEPMTTTNAYINYQSALMEYNELMAAKDVSAADAVLSAGLQQLKVEDSRRGLIDYKNAMMLGYNSPDGEALIGTAFGNQMEFTALRHARNDLIPEIETNRYFVVLLAYDFQLMWKQKKHKLLWETRFSINQPRNDFAKALPVMARTASAYFGQESHGLVRQPIPEGHVNVHEPTLIELFSPAK